MSVALPLAKAGVHLNCADSAPEMLASLRQKTFLHLKRAYSVFSEKKKND
jgi:hypothetical protein